MNKYEELLDIISYNLKEKIYFKIIDKNKYCIYGLESLQGDIRFTKIDFRIEEKSLIIAWLYLSRSNTGCGCEVINWFQRFCVKNNLDYIEIRLVNRNNIDMIRFINRFGFKIKNENEECINFIKRII